MPSVIQPTASVPPHPVPPGEQKGLPLLLVVVGQVAGGQTDRHDASQEREHLLQGRGHLRWVLKDEQKFTRCSRGERI